MIAFVVVYALAIVAPPVWLLLALSRRIQRLQLRHEPRLAMWLAAALAVLVTAFQSAVAVGLLLQGFRGEVDLSAIHAVALLVAWICVWLRVGMRHLRRVKSRRQY